MDGHARLDHELTVMLAGRAQPCYKGRHTERHMSRSARDNWCVHDTAAVMWLDVPAGPAADWLWKPLPHSKAQSRPHIEAVSAWPGTLLHMWQLWSSQLLRHHCKISLDLLQAGEKPGDVGPAL